MEPQLKFVWNKSVDFLPVLLSMAWDLEDEIEFF